MHLNIDGISIEHRHVSRQEDCKDEQTVKPRYTFVFMSPLFNVLYFCCKTESVREIMRPFRSLYCSLCRCFACRSYTAKENEELITRIDTDVIKVAVGIKRCSG